MKVDLELTCCGRNNLEYNEMCLRLKVTRVS